MSYTNIFGSALKNGGIIAKPVNYRPKGDKVIVVKIGYLLPAFRRCKSEKAHTIINTIARVLEKLVALIMNEKSEQNEQEMTAKLTSDNKLLKELVQIKNRELDMMRWKLKLPAVTIDLERATI